MTQKRVLLITGGTGGIGVHIAEKFAKNGYDIALHGLDGQEEIKQQLTSLRDLGVEVEHFGTDLSDSKQSQSLVGEVENHFGKVDVLINNAGLQYVASIEKHDPNMWDKLIAVNLTATFHSIQKVLPGMIKRGWGRIINMSSVHGKVASVDKASYVASKHGVIGLTKVTALEIARTGVTCNAICPGWVGTPLVWAQVEKRAKERGESLDDAQVGLVTDKQPSGEMLQPSEISELCLFLCSDAAKSFQGAAISVDGGWSAQ